MKTSAFLRLARRLPCLIVLTAAMLLAGGCSVVRVAQPVGEKSFALDKSEWEGAWTDVSGAMFIQIKVADAANGELLLAGVDEHDGKFTLKTLTVHVRESGGWVFASYVDEADNDKAKGLLWGRIKNEKDQITAWAPTRNNSSSWSRRQSSRVIPTAAMSSWRHSRPMT